MQDSERYRLCVAALKDFMSQAGFTDAVIGLSGGMDSSLAAVMCVDALGAARVHGVLMPGPYSSEHSVRDARELAANLGMQTSTISICEPFEAFSRVLAEACGDAGLSGLAAENTQARCRMVCLMALSNAHGWMLVNTGNKSEAAMGYSTLYGDTAGAFAPLGGLYKTEVFSVAQWRNDSAALAGNTPPIPQNVFDKPPSAELSPGQEDERAMGIRYRELDAILLASQEHGVCAADLVAQGFDAHDVDKVLQAVKHNAFKRALEPPFPQADFYGD